MQKAAAAERLVRFIAVLISEAPVGAAPGAADAAQAVEALLSLLAEHTAARDKTVRFRACQILNHALHGLSADAELGEDTVEEVQKALLVRLADKAPPVRAQAVRALARMTVPDEVRAWSGFVQGIGGESCPAGLMSASAATAVCLHCSYCGALHSRCVGGIACMALHQISRYCEQMDAIKAWQLSAHDE